MKTTRRKFVKLAIEAVALAEVLAALAEPNGPSPLRGLPDLEFASRCFRVRLHSSKPGLTAFDVDSLGNKLVNGNVMPPMAASGPRYHLTRSGNVVEYRQ